jgi:HEAT repeat protein
MLIALRLLLTTLMTLAVIGVSPAQNPPASMTESKPPSQIGGQSLDDWIKKLSDPDPSTKDAAIRIIPFFGPPAKKAIPKITSLMRDTDNSVRVSALRAVTSYPYEDPEMVKAVVKNVEEMLRTSTQSAIRIQAALAAGRIGNQAKSTIATLCDHTIKDQSSYEVRRAAAIALGQVGYDEKSYPDKRAVSSLLLALSDTALVVRLEVVKSLLYLGSPGSMEEANGERKSLLQRLEPKNPKHEADPAMQLMIRGIVIRLDSVLLAVPEQQLGTEEAKKERKQAVTRTAKYVDEIAKELTSQNFGLRVTAADVLGLLDKAGLPKINNLLDGLRKEEDKAANYEFMAHCMYAIGNLGPDAKLKAEARIKELTMHSDPTLKAVAEDTLKRLQGRKN